MKSFLVSGTFKAIGFCSLLFFSACGEVVNDLSHSIVIGSDLILDNPVEINSTNISAYPISGRCVSEADDVEVNVNFPVLATQSFTCLNDHFSGIMDLSSIGLTPGPVQFTATHSRLTVRSTKSAIYSLGSAPLAPTILTPANGSFVNNDSVTVSGTCEAGATVTITGSIATTPTTLICDISNTYSQPVTLTVSQGSKTITVSQENTNGVSPNTNSTITLDSMAPSAPTIVTPANGSLVNTTAQTVTGACEAGATVSITGNITTSPVTVICGVGNTYSRAVTLTGTQGSKTITVEQIDAAGNPSPNTNNTITLDSNPPSAPTIVTPAHGSTVNNVVQTVTGVCEVGATVLISGSITPTPVSVVCGGGSTYSRAVTLTATQGSKTITVNQTDTAGNTSTNSSSTFTLDNSAPSTPTILTPIHGSSVNTVAQTVTGACEAGATVNITGNITVSPSTVVCGGGHTYSLAVTLTATQGSKTITVNQTDTSGNTSPDVSSTFTLDSSAPSAPTIVTPANGSFVNTTAQTVTGVCEAGATVTITGNISPSSAIVVCGGGNTYSRAVTLTATQGSKTITVNQTDPAGNTSTNTNSTFTLDSSAPSAPTIVTPANGSLVNTTAQTVTGACEAGATVNITGNITVSPSTVVCGGGNTYSLAVTLTATQGSKTITVNQTDAAGNTSSNTNSTFTLDSSAPSAPTIVTPANGSLVNTTAQTVTGACEAGATVSISGDINASPVTLVCGGGNTYSQAVTLTGAQGSKTITVNQTDTAGNTSTDTNSTFTLDSSAPSAPTIVTPANGSLVNTTAQTVTGACEAGATVNITGNITPSSASVVCGGGNTYSVAVTLTATQGSKTITVNQTDPAGNTSINTSSTFTLDSSAPSAPTIVTPANGTRVNTTAQTVTGACEAGATVSISGNITTSPDTVVCGGGNTYSHAATLTPGEGSKTIIVNQRDAAGNTSGNTNSTITLDLTAPTVVLTTTANPATSLSPIPITVTFSESVTGFVAGDITVTNGTVTNLMGGPSVYTIAITPITDGNVSVSIAADQAQDLAGNNNTASNILNIVYNASLAFDMFISRWVIPTNSTAITLPLKNLALTYNFTVNWGDGTPVSTVTSFGDTDKNHTYTNAGEYIVTIQGVVQGWGSNSQTCYMSEVVQLGYMGWINMSNAFYNCLNLVDVHTTDGEEVATVTNMNSMFSDAPMANPEVGDWNVSAVTDFTGIFRHAVSANPDVSRWDVSNATRLNSFFDGATSATPNVSEWNTSNNQRLANIFRNATSANPDVSSWDVSATYDFFGAFENAVNAVPDVSGWNVSNGQDFNTMFKGATLADPDMSLWVFTDLVTAQDMLEGSGISNINYTDFLIRANTTSTINGLSLGYVPASYQPAAAAARTNLLGPRAWTFTDDGAE